MAKPAIKTRKPDFGQNVSEYNERLKNESKSISMSLFSMNFFFFLRKLPDLICERLASRF